VGIHEFFLGDFGNVRFDFIFFTVDSVLAEDSLDVRVLPEFPASSGLDIVQAIVDVVAE
jgi:hypothetical protein